MPLTVGLESLNALRGEILRIAARHGIGHVRVFGSMARGEAGPSSDLDLLVDVDDACSLIGLIAAKQEIEALTGRRVDIVTEDGLRGPRRESILRDATPL